jgi:hypothetical protein
MARALVSYQVLDADGNRAAVPIYITYSTATLAQLTTYAQSLEDLVDAVLDAKVEKISLTVDVALTGNEKADPVAGSNIQETALISWDADNTPYSFAIDLPGYFQDGFTGKTVDQTNAGFQAWRDFLNTASNTILGTDRYGNALLTVIRARKTFRKFRKQASRV